MTDQRDLAHARIGLAQGNTVPLGVADQMFARPEPQLGVGWMSNCLRLHGGIDDHAGEVRRFCSPGARRRGQALL